MAGNDNKFVVKNGLRTQNIEYLSPDRTNTIDLEMLDSDTLSWEGDSGQLFADSNGSWTVSTWFKFPVNPVGIKSGNQSWSILGRAGGIGNAETFILYVGSETDTTFGAYAPFKTAVTIRGAQTVMSDSVNTDTWNNIVLTWDISTGTYYFNTNQGSLDIGTASLQTNSSYYIGSNPGNTANHYFNGNISSVKIYNRALTSQEVLQNYNATKGRYGL